MQDPVQELPVLINELLQAPASRQREQIERYYTPDCTLTHALVDGRNREEIVRIFQWWRFANVRLEAHIQEIFLSKEGDKVFVQLIQHITRYLHGPSTLHLSMSTILYLRPAPGEADRKLICKQVDLHQFESILYHHPLLGQLLEVAVRRAASWQIMHSTRLATWAWERLLKGVFEGGRAQRVLRVLWWGEAPAPSEGKPANGKLPYTMQ